jgi:competence protein ComEA
MFRKLITLLLAVCALNAFAAVDVNQANRADLETVKGIGPGLSAKIMDARKDGAFKNWDDLVERVVGVGPKNASKLSQAGLTVAGAGYDASGTAAAPTKTAKAGKADKSDKTDKGTEAKKSNKTNKAEAQGK